MLGKVTKQLAAFLTNVFAFFKIHFDIANKELSIREDISLIALAH